MNGWKRFIRRQRGQDMVEYGLLAAFLSIVTVSALIYFGPALKPAYYKLQDAVRRAATAHYPTHNGGGGHNKRTPG